MKITFQILVVQTLFIFLLLTSSAHAVEICTTDNSDSDGDGWGWENGQSCHVGPYTPLTFPLCESNQSDSDGDGWGWENDATCQTNEALVPGNDIASASSIGLEQEINDTLSNGESHYYRFVVNESIGVLPIIDVAERRNYDIDIVDGNNDSYSGGSQFVLEGGTCLPTGTYYFVVQRRDIVSGTEGNYTASLSTVDLNCVEPSAVAENTRGNSWIGDDGYFYQFDVNVDQNIDLTLSLLKSDSKGNTIWTKEIGNFVEAIQTLESGNLLIFTISDVQLLDDQANTLWQFSSTETGPVEDYVVSGSTLVINNTYDSTIHSLNINNGSVQWRYDYTYEGTAKISTVTYSGETFVTTDSGVLIFE